MSETQQLVPKDAVQLYKMMWQFERWLRLMVYVELFASDKDWEKSIPQKKKEPTIYEKKFPKTSTTSKSTKNDWSPKNTDKNITHMVTPHESSLSYLSLTELWDIIINKKNWMLFEKYFPPKDITLSRISEIKNIRNRIMHFREPHEYDVSRMVLFLKDFESGVRLFCQSYTTGVISNEEDSLVKLLAANWDSIGYGVELHPYGFSHDYLYAPYPYRMNPKIAARLTLIRRPWSNVNREGFLYEISISSLREYPIENIESFDFKNHTTYELDFEEILRNTKDIHNKCIHICIKSNGYFSAIFPAHLGDDINITTIDTILSAGVNCRDKARMRDDEIERLKRKYPEYVLFSDNPIFRYDERMTESLIDLD